jgi:hypothetical protein
MDISEATTSLQKRLPDGAVIRGATEEGELFLFLATRPDPLEGRLDPFFSVNKRTGEIRDFSPQEFDNPVDVLTRLNAYEV